MENKKVLILQSNYIPWIGYFHLINSVDEFIIYDTVQYTRRDWRNRNKILFQQQEKWLSIPVKNKGNYHANINQMELQDGFRFETHLESIKQAYKNYPYFEEIFSKLERLFFSLNNKSFLSEINHTIINEFCQWLSIESNILRSEDLPTNKSKAAALIDICQQTKATSYLTGPSGMNYIQPQDFENAGIELEVFNYPDYKLELPETYTGLSIIHLFMYYGTEKMKSVLKKSINHVG